MENTYKKLAGTGEDPEAIMLFNTDQSVYWRFLFTLPLFLIFVFLLRHGAAPAVIVHSPKEAVEKLGFVWRMPDRVHASGRGGLYPGEASLEYARVFPGQNYFIEFYWWGKSTRPHCICINPQWPVTHIYLDLKGDIDTNESTHFRRLSRCRSETIDKELISKADFESGCLGSQR